MSESDLRLEVHRLRNMPKISKSPEEIGLMAQRLAQLFLEDYFGTAPVGQLDALTVRILDFVEDIQD